MFTRAYQNRTVLVTGHTGFKGSWLTHWLTHLGANVVGFSADPPYEPGLCHSASSLREVIDVRGDIRDQQALNRVFDEHTPEVVFHLAAQPLVRRSYTAPIETIETNVLGTARVFEAVRRSHSVCALINVTSDKCYENQGWVWAYRENDPMGGYDPYSASKGCAELLLSAWERSYFNTVETEERVGCVSVRAGNVIGGGDWAKDRLIPDCARALSKGETIVLRSPAAVRPWQHVLEPLSGYLTLGVQILAGRAMYSGGWNFGPAAADHWNVESVVAELCEIWGNGRYQVTNAAQPHEARCLRLDCTKAHADLNWHPRWDLSQALRETISWYQRFSDGASTEQMQAYTLQQIQAYESLIVENTSSRHEITFGEYQ